MMPKGWTPVRVGDVAEVVGGGTPSTKEAEYWDGDIPWLTPRDLSRRPARYTSRGDRSITELGLARSSARMMPPGTVLLTSRAPIGYVTIASNAICTNQGFKSLILDSSQVPEFWYYLLGSSVELLHSVASGSTFQEISGTALAALEFLVPSKKEQQRIATFLGTLDNLIEVNLRLATSMDELADKLFDSWAADLEQTVHFGDIACRVAVKAAPTDDDPYLGLEHFGENAAGLIGASRASKVISQTSKFERGDVLYGKLRPYFRKVARPDFAGCCSTEVWVLRGRDKVPQSYIHWVTRQRAFTDHADAASEGTRMPRANWTQVSQFLVPEPRQSGLLQVAAAADLLWEAANQLRAESREAARARDELLPLLLSGEATFSEVAA